MSTKQNILVEEEIVESVELEAGTILKQKREELGLTQKQIADRLRLKLSIIKDIENNNFEIGQVATFTRGYLRSYAKAVGIEESAILEALGDEKSAKPQAQNMTSFSRKTKREKHDSRIMIITWGILAIIIGISSLWWWQNQQRDTLLSPSNNNVEAPATPANSSDSNGAADTNSSAPQAPKDSKTDFTTLKSGQLTSGTANKNSSPADKTEETNTAPVTNTEPATQPKVEPSAPSSQVTPQSSESSPSNSSIASKTIDMSFKADCWLQVKDATGKVLVSGIKKGGQSLKLAGEAPFNVILGAPENVSMTFASEPVDLSRYTPGKVARFTLP